MWDDEFKKRVKGYAQDYYNFTGELLDGQFIFSSIKESFENGKLDKVDNEIWGDTLQITLGSRPVSIKPVVPVKGRTRCMVESRATVVFSQGISGVVLAIIYPPRCEVFNTDKEAYLFYFWDSPGKVKRKHVYKILSLLCRMDYLCSVEVFPNKKGQRVLLELELKDSILSAGGSKIWNYIKYSVKFSKASLRMYGIGSPKV